MPNSQKQLPGETETDLTPAGKRDLEGEVCISQRQTQETGNIKGRDKSKSNAILYNPPHCSLYVETLV